MTAPYDSLDTNLPLVDENGKITPEFEDYLYKHDILISSATPEASVTANPSTLCLDATNSILYIKKTGTGNTGWMAVGGTGSGGVSDGDKGDITVSGSGTVWTIDNDAVSLAKFVNATAQYKLLGRVSSGSGDFEEISSSSNVFSILQAADYAEIRTLLGLVIGTNVQAYDATLTAFAAYNTNGLLTQTAADTFTGRTITGTTNQVTVTNGDGVSGNPTLSLPQDISTTSNPQFATIELGAATDTTVARASAGRISVEGVEVALMSDLFNIEYYGGCYTTGTASEGSTTTTTLSTVYNFAMGTIADQTNNNGVTGISGGGLRNTSGSAGLFYVVFGGASSAANTTPAQAYSLGYRMRETDDTTYGSFVICTQTNITNSNREINYSGFVYLEDDESVIAAIRRDGGSSRDITWCGAMYMFKVAA